MLFAAPDLQDIEREVLEQIDGFKQKLRLQLREPRRWSGSLRRAQFARAVQGSNSIEGFNAALDDAVAIDLGEEPLDASEETTSAIRGYRDAMTFVLQLSSDGDFEYSELLIKSLHFMMTSYDLKNRPGQWRPGLIYVQREETGEVVYEGAPREDVPALVSELVESLNAMDSCPPMVLAGMAHLNLVMIHPFRDGNGRMARCLQTLVLAREGILSPVFSSIEEYLGRNTEAYYDVLAEVGGGIWQPHRDARPWLRFTLTAHLRQARTVVRRVKESERLWLDLERLVKKKGLPERALTVLWDAAMGYRVRNVTYRAAAEEMGDDMTEQVASRDLRQLVDTDLLAARGEKRGRYYVATEELRKIRRAIIDARDPRDDADPFLKAS